MSATDPGRPEASERTPDAADAASAGTTARAAEPDPLAQRAAE
jgi:hypothetical protein